MKLCRTAAGEKSESYFKKFGSERALISTITVGARIPSVRERLLFEEDHFTTDKDGAAVLPGRTERQGGRAF